MRRCLIFAVLVFLAAAPRAHAGWTELGGPLNTETTDTVGNQQQIVDVGGVPWVTWTERADGAYVYQVHAAHWNGNAWVQAGGALNVDPEQGASNPTIASVGGVPYVTWAETSQLSGEGKLHVRVARWTGSAWEAVGGQLDADQGTNPHIAAVGGEPYVMYAELLGGGLHVKRYTGSGWVEVGTGVPSAEYVYRWDIVAVGSTPYVTWSQLTLDFKQEVHAARFVDGAWTELGTKLNHDDADAGSPVIADLGGVAGVAWFETDASQTYHVRVATWNGTAWADVGPEVGTTGLGNGIGIGISLARIGGRPVVAWPQSNGLGAAHQVSVSTFDGDDWIGLGRPVAHDPDHNAGSPSLVGIGGVPHLGYFDRYQTSQGDSDALHYLTRVARLGDDAETAHLRFSTPAYTVTEGTPSVAITVQRTGGLSGAVSVAYATADGTAKSGQDYTGGAGRLHFGDGETAKVITVPITADTAVEPDETFTVALSDPVGDAALVAPSTTTVTIANTDAVDTAIDVGPDGYLTDLFFRFFVFHADPGAGSTFECWLDDAAPAPCTNPYDPGANLTEGEHTVHIRATSAAGTPDPTPATRTFFVDTIRPTTTATVSGARAGDAYAESATVNAVGSDSGSGVRELRCQADPPEVPDTASSLRGACPLTVTTPGEHTVYAAAVDKAGNASIPAKVTFRVVQVPDTTITGGPQGPVFQGDQTFSFTSSVPGSTFQCRFDDDAAFPCTSPRSTGLLAGGAHTFQVAAVSPDGAVDPTPARREFAVETIRPNTCTIKPFLSDLDFDGQYNGCEWGGVQGELFCDTQTGWRCTRSAPVCPIGALCRGEVRVTFRDADERVDWTVIASVENSGSNGVLGGDTADGDCSTIGKERSCSKSAAVSWLGDGVHSLRAYCYAFTFSHPRSDYGPDSARSLVCTSSITVKTVAPLATQASGNGVAILAPGAGTLQVTPGGQSRRSARARVARKAVAPFKRVKVTAKRAGPVAVRLTLSPAAKRALRKHRKLSLALKIAFAPAGGGARINASARVTVRQPAKRKKVCRKKRGKRICTV